jgi:hypothetical protein
VALALSSLTGCGPQLIPTAIAWTPGRYSLEATVGEMLSAGEIRAQLTIAPGGEMSLASSTGLCRDRDASDMQRDLSRGQMMFECGDATFRVRPVPGSVRGEVNASVLEEYQAETACPPSRPGPCYIMRTQRVNRRADLVVQLLR